MYAAALLSLFLLQGPDEPRKDKTTYHATLEFTVSQEKLTKHAITANEVNKQLEAFFKDRKSFSLADLESVMVSNTQGMKYPLRELVKVDVQFKLPKKE